MIDSGKVKDQAELAKIKGISRARVTQILNLLKLDSLVIIELEKLGDPLKSRIITERILRPYGKNYHHFFCIVSLQISRITKGTPYGRPFCY